jgi:hypothetical protein
MTENGGADQFLDTIRVALADPHPLPLLLMASAIVATLNQERQAGLTFIAGQMPGASVQVNDFCQSLLHQGEVPSLALAGVIGEIAGDDVLRARIHRELVARKMPVPGWIHRLDQTRVSGVVAMSDVLGDGQNIVVEATLPGDHSLSGVVYVDHNMGTVVKDAFFLPAPLSAVQAAWSRAEDEQPDLVYGSTTSDLSAADARARLTEAVEEGHRFDIPIQTENWPACEPLLAWLLGMMPAGGSGYPFVELQESELVALAEDFFNSQWGKPLDTAGNRVLIDAFLDFSSGSANGDALRWSAVSVEMLLMAWLPRTRSGDIHLFDEVPNTLRALIRYSHSERGIAPELTAETVAAVALWEPQFAALVAQSLADRDEVDESDEVSEAEYYGYLLEGLSDEVGGPDALTALDVAPLADEPFDWSAIAEDIAPRVRDIVDQVDVAVPALFGGSHGPSGRTTEYPVDELGAACRRFLFQVAVTDPRLFRRKGATKTFAAAVVWIVGKANDVVGQHRGLYRVQSKQILAHFAVGSVTERAEQMLTAVGANRQYDSMGLGDAALLTSATRQRIIAERDAALTWLAGVSEPDSRA